MTAIHAPKIRSCAPSPGADLKDKFDALIADAMKHPGVAAIMKFHESSEQANVQYGVYQAFQNPFVEIATTSSSLALNAHQRA